MVSRCANPACNKSLHYLRDGKVFLFSSRKNASKERSNLPQRLEHFWLCGACVKRWTLAMDGDDQVTLVEMPRRGFQSNYGVISAARAL